ncbi:MAG: type 4a pilus biogenesis protein PilO [Candidatus Omnitrophica bacterium]|nr:type 4a pilus biogenesis protein PilO [Candidatus Omnitrophota bacterium]
MKPLNLPFADILAFVKTVDKKTWVIVVACAVVFLLVVIFLVIPAWIERPMLRRDIQGMKAQIRQINELNEKQKGWEESRKVFGALIESTQARVFTAGDMDMLLGQVSKMASESRVDVLTSKPLTEKAVFPSPYNIKYQPSGYEFSVQGGYHDLANLASRIEGHEKLLRIHSLEIVPAEKTPERHIAELTLWAIIKAPPQPPAPAKKAPKAKNVKK